MDEKLEPSYKGDSDVDRSSSPGSGDPNSYTENGANRMYEAKCALVNKCLQEDIKFGRYQWGLFAVSGMGWLADNCWFQGIAVILPQVQQELNPTRVEFTTLALYAGLILGATTWGVLADLIGRRISFNITLFLAGIFGLVAGASDNFVTFAALVACLGFGVGGNLPVDGALYLEHIPQSHQWTLTLLSVWWAFGQLLASLIAWVFIANFSCHSDIPQGECTKADNMGWRYTMYTLGTLTIIMAVMRAFVFDLQESSKYLIGKGRDQEAIEVLQHLARYNGTTIRLTTEQLRAVEGNSTETGPTSIIRLLRNTLSNFSLSHVKPLFSGRRLALNTSITFLLWGLIGLASPLFNSFLPLYLANRFPTNGSVSQTYRNNAIISVLGIPGSFIACAVVDYTRAPGKWQVGGRKLSMAVSTCLTGLFLFLFTTSKSEAAVLGYSCVTALTQNAMFGVLYAYTPEVFPAPHRGTGGAIATSFNRVTGILAPVIKIATTTSMGAPVSGSTANSPTFVAASLFVVAAASMLLLPIETAGKAAL